MHQIDILEDLYQTKFQDIGLETFLPREICVMIWRMNKQTEFRDRIKNFEKSGMFDRLAPIIIKSPVSETVHCFTPIGTYVVYNQKDINGKRRPSKRLYSISNKTYHFFF